jgi:cell division septation protein DedD
VTPPPQTAATAPAQGAATPKQTAPAQTAAAPPPQKAAAPPPQTATTSAAATPRGSAAPPQTAAPQQTPSAAKPQPTPPAQAATKTVAPAQAVGYDAVLRSGYAVQVAAVDSREEADRLVARFVTRGYPAYFVRGEGAAANFYRVRIGTYVDRAKAEEVAKQLAGTDGIKPWIAKEVPDKPK